MHSLAEPVCGFFVGTYLQILIDGKSLKNNAQLKNFPDGRIDSGTFRSPHQRKAAMGGRIRVIFAWADGADGVYLPQLPRQRNQRLNLAAQGTFAFVESCITLGMIRSEFAFTIARLKW